MENVPYDFSRGFSPATLPGGRPKFLALDIGKRYVVGLPKHEWNERWFRCEDLTRQLAVPALRRPMTGRVSNLDAFDRKAERRVGEEALDLSDDQVIRSMKNAHALEETLTPSSSERLVSGLVANPQGASMLGFHFLIWAGMRLIAALHR